MDIQNITDITQLKVMLADEFTRREQAATIHQQASNNIVTLQQRIAELNQAIPVGDEEQSGKHNKK